MPTSRLIQLFLRHPDYFIQEVSFNQPLSIQQIRKYQSILFWGAAPEAKYSCLSTNVHLSWSRELLNEFIDQWCWESISEHIIGRCIWFNNILNEYEEQIHWKALSNNQHIKWTIPLLKQYEHKLNWQTIPPYGSSSFEVTEELLSRFGHRLNMTLLSETGIWPWSPRSELQTKPAEKPIVSSWLNTIETFEDKWTWELPFLTLNWRHGLTSQQINHIIETICSNLLQKPKTP